MKQQYKVTFPCGEFHTVDAIDFGEAAELAAQLYDFDRRAPIASGENRQVVVERLNDGVSWSVLVEGEAVLKYYGWPISQVAKP